MPRPNAVRADTHDQQSGNHDATTNGNHSQMGQQDGEELERELADAEVAGDSEGEFSDDDIDKMSSSPSITDEDIDFELVYALHHFTATVEGQANAAKGEHMVLLDDSNSYWWLVRIVRDSSVGYLPAEHIETGNERLARLNKHRNIDLAANMLSDSVNEKSRNPLKKAMRRRHAKTVVFTDPIYHEASEYEYSDDEEEGEGEGEEGEYEEEGSNVEVHREEPAANGTANGTTAQKETVVSPVVKKTPVNVLTPPSDPRTSSDSSGSSRKGSEDSIKLRPNPSPVALRHPDSAIFRDEGQGGTKKLTLTPNLLRDDDVGSPATTKPERGSLDREQKREEGVLSPPPAKGGRLRKGSVLGNFFKKRNKKGRKDEEDDVEEWLHSAVEKKSLDSTRSTPMESPNGRAEETRKQREDAQLIEAQRIQETQRQQQQQPQQQQPQQQQQQQQQRPRDSEQTEREAQQRRAQTQAQQASAAAAVTASTIRRVESADSQASSKYQESSPVEPRKPEYQPQTQPQPQTQRELNVQAPAPIRARSPAGIVAPINTNVHGMKPHPQQRKLTDERPAYSPRSYQPARVQDFQPQPQPQQQQQQQDRLSESPEHITFHDATERPDTSSGDDTSSLEMIDRSSTFETTTTSPGTAIEEGGGGAHTITRTWSDWSLRTYFEDDNDVRDMLIVVQQDKGEVTPQKQHPEIAPLFADSSRRLEDITKQLDGMLGEWMARRRRARW